MRIGSTFLVRVALRNESGKALAFTEGLLCGGKGNAVFDIETGKGLFVVCGASATDALQGLFAGHRYTA
jgi:hypothetical protein